MICIACGSNEETLAKSHVISNFVRKRLTGETGADGSRKFTFKWVDRNDLPKQDLPKPYLMCKKCDNTLGATVERDTAALLMPDNVDHFDAWRQLPILRHQICGVFDDPLNLGVYDYPLSQQFLIEKFALSTAWRALHALAKDGKSLSKAFLASARGRDINQSVIRNLFDDVSLENTFGASLYYWSPYTVQFITDKDDEMPFAWTELGDQNEILGVAVIFAYWAVVWPLFEYEPMQYFDKLDRLHKACFLDWIAQVRMQLSR
ncbi:hypothetical protein [Pseudomonas sp. S1Bt23]|uniref:hypothetical protein n=1 Tax=Pseudomonas sp. S1Bt23 TaxID=3095074 RepID=UPI002A5A3874|nr:hypothetical protein [Pseudomonas sp. S1Bt23]WPO48684.1 hypothetical protein SHB59_06300 [Pseudomonas sp. S1Bt23]